MDYFDIISKSVEKIEKNINEKLNIEAIADACCMSEFHFHRVFKSFTGYSLINYVRKRKMRKIAEELIFTEKRIIDIAFDYGYESNEALTRAIKNESGMTPVQLRKSKNTVIGIDKISLWTLRYNNRYSEEEYKFEIIYLNDFYFEGLSSIITLDEEKNYKQVSELIGKLKKVKEKINIKTKEKNERQFGIAKSEVLDISNPYNNTFEYFRGYSCTQSDNKRKEIKYIPINGVKCAKFWVGDSVEKHRKAIDYIFGIWIVKSGCMLDGTVFDFMEEIVESEKGLVEIYFYIPIK